MEDRPQSFPLTRWSLVLSAKSGEPDAAFKALEALAQAYRLPIYAWLRGQGRSHEEAQDDAQGFFAYLLSREFLRNLQGPGTEILKQIVIAKLKLTVSGRNQASKFNLMKFHI